MMLRWFIALLACVVLVAAATPPARAETGAKPASPRSFLPPSRAAAPPPVQTAHGPLTRLAVWIQQKQAELHRGLAKAVRDLKTANPLSAALTLALLSFGYGIFHAAGPGHGKAVISSYVLANERTVRRGIILAFLAAFVQAMTAIVLVSALALVFKASGMTMKWAVNWLETASYALIAAVGAWMLVTQLRKALRRPATAEPMAAPAPHRHVAHAELAASHHGHAHAHAHDCGHDHHHQHGHHHHGHGDATRAPHPAHVHHDDCCGHAHMPSPQQLEGAWNTRKALAMAFAVGVRPCTGAVLVLVFALTQGLFWAGVGATFAMALGTAITVSVLAALAVGSRELAIKLTGGEGPWARRVHAIAGIGGSVLVLMLGVLFLIGSITQPTVF